MDLACQASQSGDLDDSKYALPPAREANIGHSGIPWLPQAVPRGTDCHQEVPKASKLESRGNCKWPERCKNSAQDQLK